eukprot:TRINITY_DN10478_c0_g2_i1.p1 TRINITY_DN10478_c0_g2~~TRINITY_DN10478_c0_g2_i1.p1  ORF type:complete len:352 (+),score=45.21 TRINITY_DN10478_c0_g2_i1:563-1618(+)
MIRTSQSYPSDMGQRNMLFNSQMLGLVIDPGQSTLHQEHHIFLRDTNGPAYPSIHPLLSSLGSAANLNLYPLFGNHDSNMFYGHHYHVGGDPSSFNWSYMPHMPYFQGSSVSAGSLETGSRGEQEYQNTTFSNNSTILLHPPIHYYNFHYPPLVQGIQGLNYHFHHPIPAPFYRHHMNHHFHHRTMRNTWDGRESLSSYPRHFYRPQRRVSQYAPVEISGRIRILPSEEVAVLEFPSMQPYTNDASYEELLALEERIGNVNTGLSERTIINCLQTRTHTSCTTSSDHDESSEMDQNSICVVCQAEYEENDNIGILGCGQEYHVDCIKQWLLLKNLCPMCKRPAFSMDNNES